MNDATKERLRAKLAEHERRFGDDPKKKMVIEFGDVIELFESFVKGETDLFIATQNDPAHGDKHLTRKPSPEEYSKSDSEAFEPVDGDYGDGSWMGRDGNWYGHTEDDQVTGPWNNEKAAKAASEGAFRDARSLNQLGKM